MTSPNVPAFAKYVLASAGAAAGAACSHQCRTTTTTTTTNNSSQCHIGGSRHTHHRDPVPAAGFGERDTATPPGGGKLVICRVPYR